MCALPPLFRARRFHPDARHIHRPCHPHSLVIAAAPARRGSVHTCATEQSRMFFWTACGSARRSTCATDFDPSRFALVEEH